MNKIVTWLLRIIGKREIVSIPLKDDKWHTVVFLYKKGENSRLLVDYISIWDRKLTKKDIKILFCLGGKV